MAAAPGNQYAAKARRWSDAIDRAIEKRSRITGLHALDELAEQLLKQVDEGDVSAIKELGDRIEGKVPQAIIGPGDAGEHTMITRIEEVIVDPHS